MALIGAMCFGELGARHPHAGGSYVYLREVFGPLPAFLYGWTYLVAIFAVSSSILSNPANAAIGAALIAAGIPVFFYWKRG